MKRLILVDHAAQAPTVARLAGGAEVVALTADALQALEERGISAQPVCRYADTYALVDADQQLNLDTLALAKEIEDFIAADFPAARVEGPGILSGHSYYLQYSVGAIAKRGHLMKETVRRLQPEAVTVFAGPVHDWFRRDGYVENPWVSIARDLSDESGFTLEVLGADTTPPAPDQVHEGRRFRDLRRRAFYSARRRLRESSETFFRRHRIPENVAGLRVLNVHAEYDWAPAYSILKASRTASIFQLTPFHVDSKQWLASFAPQVRTQGRMRPVELDIAPFRADPAVRERIHQLFDKWVSDNANRRLLVDGLDCLPGLIPQLRETAAVGPDFVRYTDAVVEAAFDSTRPHAICFMGMPSYADRRLAYRARLRRIPVACYQHAFGYGVQVQPKDEQTEVAHADYFLTYGDGVRPRPNAAFVPRARYVSVGSTRLERMAQRASERRASAPGVPLRVLWVGEVSFANTYALSLTEDTQRFLQERRCLELLGTAPGLRVTYRPYRFSLSWDGTQRWLDRRALPYLRTDISTPLEGLISRSDIIVMETSSPTAWAEAIVLRRPVILFCDPRQNPLVPDFAARLGKYCYWCRSSDELLAAMQRLKNDQQAFVEELRSLNSTPFLKDYALHERNSAERVVSFLSTVCRGSMALAQWQGDSIDRHPPDTVGIDALRRSVKR